MIYFNQITCCRFQEAPLTEVEEGPHPIEGAERDPVEEGVLQEVGGVDTAHLQAGGVLAETEADLIKKSHQMARCVELCCYHSPLQTPKRGSW